MRWTQHYPGHACMVQAVRAFVAAMLADCPRRDDGVLIASELATNSLRHGPGDPSSDEIIVAVDTAPGWARIAVSDPGTGKWQRTLFPPDEEEDRRRDLFLCEQISDGLGHCTDDDGQTIWAELTWESED